MGSPSEIIKQAGGRKLEIAATARSGGTTAMPAHLSAMLTISLSTARARGQDLRLPGPRPHVVLSSVCVPLRGRSVARLAEPMH